MKRRIAIALTLLVVASYGYLSVDRCGSWPPGVPQVGQLARSQGPLRAGAARVDLTWPFPAQVGGYGPFPPSVDRALTPFSARALHLEVGGQHLSIVLLDVLLVPPALRDAIGKDQPEPVWVLATHTHTGPAGYDRRQASELGALGRFHAEDEARLVAAAREAITKARASLGPVTLTHATTQLDGFSVARSGEAVDPRLTRLTFDGEHGPLAQVLLLSAHPTLVPRRPEGLHADWPGLLAQRWEQGGGPVTFVLQSAAGNASVDRARFPDAEAAAVHLETVTRALTGAPEPGPLDAAWNEVRLALPRPDASRLAPVGLRAAAENVLCEEAEDLAVLHGLRLGPVRWLFVPFEPSFAAGQVLEEQAQGARVVSLADGYSGYLETEAHARTNQGEAHRQYFDVTLLTQLVPAARLAGEALGR